MCKVGDIILIDKYKHGTNCKVIEDKVLLHESNSDGII